MEMDKTMLEQIEGIECYKHEQQVLLRLIRKSGGLTASKFDKLFQGREFKKRTKLHKHGLSGDSFILGIGANGFNMWSENLDLLQRMIAVDLVDTVRNKKDEIVYVSNVKD